MVRAGLVEEKDERLSDVDSRRSRGSPDNLLSNVLAREGLESFVHLVRRCLFAPESADRKVSLDHARLNLGDSNRSANELLEESRSEGIVSKLCDNVDEAAGVSLPACDRAKHGQTAAS